MKNKILIFALLLFTSASFAQNVQLHYDFERGHATSTVEMFKVDDWGNTFFFIDMDYNGDKSGINLSYWEIARELKFWDAPISAHLEYNGGALKAPFSVNIGDSEETANPYLQINNAFLAGPSYTYLAKDFSYGITFMALYKYITLTPTDKPHNFQLTGVWFLNMFDNKLTFSGFADLWKEDTFFGSEFTFLAEPQLWFNATKHFSLGGEVEIANNFGADEFKVRPTLAVKWNF